MNIKYLISLPLTLVLINLPAMSYAQTIASLQEARAEVIKNYVVDLEKADYHSIVQLFDTNGTVISTSRGRVNAKDFYYGFLPEIISAQTVLNQTFSGNSDTDRMAARFHFTFKLKDGETGDGEYVDEFVFNKNSAMLSSVYMFENLQFDKKL